MQNIRVALLLSSLLAAACSSGGRSASSDSRVTPEPGNPVAVGRYGIGCRTYQKPNIVGPPSYRANDVGRPGVPPLSQSQRRMLHSIQRYVHSRTLRFAFLDNSFSPFVIFDAEFGPCTGFAPGYWVMNSTSVNTYYEPGEAPGDVHAVPGEAAPTAGPWMLPNKT